VRIDHRLSRVERIADALANKNKQAQHERDHEEGGQAEPWGLQIMSALLKKLASEPAQGGVLVVDGGGSLGCALIGDIIADLAVKNGWAGAVIYGAIRDVLAIDQLDFGVKALGSSPKRSGKTGAGQLDVPVSFGGVTFVPGHWLYSDEDGILVSEKQLVT